MSYSNTELVIIHEDTDLLVINKQAGITVNRSQTTTGEKTVQDLVEEYLHIGGVETKNEESEGDEDGGVGSISGSFATSSGCIH